MGTLISYVIFVFDSIEQYELESDNFINRFTELVSEYRTYDSKIIKATPYSILDEQIQREEIQNLQNNKFIKEIRKSEHKASTHRRQLGQIF